MGSCLSTVLPKSRRMPSASESTASTYSPPAGDVKANTYTSKGVNVEASILVNDDNNHPRPNPGTSNDASVNASIPPVSTQNQDDKREVESLKRRALLVGITYTGPHNKWSQLDGPHDDVDRYRELLTSA